MKLSELENGQNAIIKDIDLPNELKQRFNSMGLIKGELIHICRVGFLRGSFYVKIAHNSCVILSKNEAKHIEVELLKKGFQHRWGKRGIIDMCDSCCQDDKS